MKQLQSCVLERNEHELESKREPPRGEQTETEPVAKELFMASLGLTKVTNTLSSSIGTRTRSSRQTRQTLREDLPQRFELSRLSFSALRCNECYLCEGVEYPCVRCRQQFHQECQADQGRPQPHRLCPSCTRQTSLSHSDDRV